MASCRKKNTATPADIDNGPIVVFAMMVCIFGVNVGAVGSAVGEANCSASSIIEVKLRESPNNTLVGLQKSKHETRGGGQTERKGSL